jgi:quaternary ammonium compound-resistance protein SugE
MARAWFMLIVAGILEIAFAIGLKYCDGFTKFWPSVVTLATVGSSFYLLSLAIRTIPLGTGYAVWTGIGAAGTAIVGIVHLGEPATLARVGFLAMIFAGVIGVRVTAQG